MHDVFSLSHNTYTIPCAPVAPSNIPEYTPVNNCQEQASLSYSAPVPTNGTISLTPEIFVNDPDPRQVGDEELTAESSRISGLEEFVSYTFLVTIANTVGDIVATDVGCAITDAVGEMFRTHILTHAIT